MFDRQFFIWYHSDVMSHSRQLSVRVCRKSAESSPQSSYKSPHSTIDSLDSLEGSIEPLVSSSSVVSIRAWLSEISLHQYFSLVWLVRTQETAGRTGLGVSFRLYPAMHR